MALVKLVADALDPLEDPYSGDPEGWIDRHLREAIWSKQREILTSIEANRHTACKSAHSTGKSHIASRAVAYWIDTHEVDEVFVVTTAPSATQVKAILWRYTKAAHRKGNLRGYITESEIPEWKIDGRLVAYGRKPQDLSNVEEAKTAFQGIHAKYVLVILDEAGGVPPWLWEAVESLVTAPTNRVLAIGNPDDPSSEFAKVCEPGSGWNVITISAFDTPAFTGEDVPDDMLELLVSPEWVEERKKRWGEKSPLYISKVLAEFPEVTDDTLISPKLVREAQERDLAGLALGRFGMDVARHGPDETCAYRNREGVIRLALSKHKQDTMATADDFADLMDRYKDTVPGVIDAIGVGAGVYDRLRRLRFPVIPFEAGGRPVKPQRYKNKRAEQWWMVRVLFEEGLIDIDPDDDVLASQLTSIKYARDKLGRVVIESKEDMKKRGMPSPDRADALMMSTVVTPEIPENANDSPAGSATLTGDLLTRPM